MPAKFQSNIFNPYLRTKVLGHSVTSLEETDSTMNDAKNICSQGYATHGQIIIADFQTAGRGRVEGRSWEASAAKNILCTLLLEKDKVNSPNIIPLVVPAAITKSLREIGLNAAIKWPNDVLVGGKKISGMMVNDEKSFYAVGFGVNINQQFGEHELNSSATSVIDVLQYEVLREEILASILNNLEVYLSMPLDQIVEIYKQYCALIPGTQVTIYPNGKEKENVLEIGIVEGLSECGFLIVDVAGQKKTLSAHDVSVRSQHLPEYLLSSLLPRPIVRKTIDGQWRNTLGSFVTFETHDDSTLTGFYQTAVGNVPSEHRYPLSGRFTLLPNGNALLGWVVAWDGIPLSITTWSATFSLNEKLDLLSGYSTSPSIISTWLLTSNEPQWKAVLTNKDIFTKVANN